MTDSVESPTPGTAYGANRCAEWLAEACGLPVRGEDITALAAAGLLAEAGEYKGWTLYDPQQAVALADHPRLAEQVTAREWAWELTIHPASAARELGWTDGELAAAAAEHQLQTRDGRYARADIHRLRTDHELRERIRLARLVDAGAAAAILEVRRVDLDYLVAGGLIEPVERQDVDGPIDAADVSGGRFRVAELEQLREHPAVDWEAVRGVPAGKPSALRELFRALPSRAQQVRALADRLTAQFGVTIEPVWHEPTRRRQGWWEFVWAPGDDGTPVASSVRRAIGADVGGRRYVRDIALTARARTTSPADHGSRP